MGSVQTKDIITPSTTPVKIQKQITEHSFISPSLQRTISASREDPRSPGGRRTPLQSPHSTPNLSKNTRERMMMRLTASKQSQDPRSPSVINRTPLQLSAVDGVPRTPPPFRSGDPRSPYMARTPLALSTQDTATVPDALVIVGQEIAGEPIVFAEEIVFEEGKKIEIPIGASVEIVEASTSVDTMSANMTTENFNSPVISDQIMALVMSPLNSPSLGTRKRKDIARTQGLSPLKKSYSAPDENTPPSPVNKSIASTARPRAPLSPLTQRAMNSRYCVGVPPIKFRMDPGILG